ncbi:excinuclease ABC subunit C [Granulicella sp. S190]|uniref:excinuclease ABC subunit C n=1 Tax=Granulicella sp. S190 TaxID=1747226 RepID=UPI00131E8019|nr:excinuclease ABC subunit C [Granulicella sp. S190]
MATSFHFEHVLDFTPGQADEILRAIPALPGVFALCGARAEDSPYLTQTTDLRRRMRRLLDPPESQSKRLNLREKVARIEYCVTGSAFESSLVLYQATAAHFGYTEARRRLKLHTPYFLRMTMENPHPRVYSTNKLSKRGLAQMYGPFPSRLSAERYCDAVLDLFKLRRCYEDLAPHPEHPGCLYGEMKKCIEPCKQACTPEEYAVEAESVKKFFDTRGESMIISIGLEREVASSAMQFEKAASLHAQWQKVKAAQTLADWIVRPIPRLRAIIVQAAGDDVEHPDHAALFLLNGGCIVGPEHLSTLGVRAVREQTSVGSSLFAQPLMLQAVPLEGEPTASNSPETRAAYVLSLLEKRAEPENDLALLSDHLSLLRRWYYRPEKQRNGEIFFPNEDTGEKGAWPIRKILRGAARLVVGDPKPMAETQRDAAKEAAKGIKTKILHEGRPDVERVVPVPPKNR